MRRQSGLGRSPSREMTAADVLYLVHLLEGSGVSLWLDGGWAVDAVLGSQTRAHDDLDVVVDTGRTETLRSVLAGRGFVLARGGAPRSFELVDEVGRQVDVHPVRFTADGDGLYAMEDGEDWVYPASGFGGRGTILGTTVPCLTPEAQVHCHTGYEPHLSSYDDVWALSRRFGIAVPDEYVRPRETYSARS